MSTKLIKGLIMTIFSAIMPMLTTTPIAWGVVGIMTVGTMLQYFGKNKLGWQSTSPAGQLNAMDYLSALCLAIGTAIISAIASVAGTGHFDWPYTWHLIYTTGTPILLAYIGGTGIEGSNKPLPVS
jgi:hypothetical protein